MRGTVDERIGKPEGLEIEEPEVKVPDGNASRAQWGRDLEFLFSCIAFSVGLGNVWRFPYTAYENGGGAFLIPYLVVLFVIGKPFYYMEMILGQFSSKSCVGVWSVSPGFKGIGVGVTLATFCLTTYYCVLMALTLFYLISSFQTVLPWSECWDEWGDRCLNFSTSADNFTANNATRSSSAELYFTKVVLHEINDISGGLGTPGWKLVLCLIGSWSAVFSVLSRGLKGTGKASYFLALFPYVILITLFVKAVSLPGAIDGIVFLYKPNWEKIMEAQVWYAAVTQAFFSLGVCFGAVTMYSSYNNFRHDVHRDCWIVTTLDLFTSLLAGTTIFGILGNLAHELGYDDITTVVRGGTGLAFISYPEALAKFSFAPQLFSVIFFLMLFVLGLGSNVAFCNVVISVITDSFPRVKNWLAALAVSVTGCTIGLIYCTPGGQHMLNLVDYFGVTFTITCLAGFEVVAISWVYGVDNFMDDVEFMSEKRPSIYWRISWGFLTPVMLFTVLVYFVLNIKPLTYNDGDYPTSAIVAGWALLFVFVGQFPVALTYTKLKNKDSTLSDIFRPTSGWGPSDPELKKRWLEFKKIKQHDRSCRKLESTRARIIALLTGR
ncbi:sodium-dependent nutrient amino acid transporter 1-like isoform X1 [Athalia rosae]|uniref:sodium-dependent nutrient amino acid transporter 1-like isoform X1 n=1 Tax=Athalia rosae TaxID=37344 RepID=UPI0020343836|nr:sodium-dependent nutrient amino acid transporter 1-like isoform X1 [Athalia rosae]